MEEKKSNVCLSADVLTASEVLDLAEKLGPHIVVLKTHVDIISDFTPDFSLKIKSLANKHKFIIFEDRKLADIGSTVVSQYSGGIYKISQWSDLVTVHSIPGPGILDAIRKVAPKDSHGYTKGVLLLAQMSSAGNLADTNYCKRTIEIGEKNLDIVAGFIAQSPLSSNPAILTLTPGVSLSSSNDNIGQQYVTPEVAILERGADLIIVGRGIIAQSDPLAVTISYKEEAWAAYLKRIQG